MKNYQSGLKLMLQVIFNKKENFIYSNNLVTEDVTERYGRGRRERPEIVYNDGLTDSQFSKVILNE